MTSNNVTLIGFRQSTFTLTIRLALHYYQVPHDHIAAYPHSEQVKAHSPFGKVPVLLVPERSEALLETMVMRTYLDRTYSSNNVTSLTPSTFEKQLDMNFWISIVSDHLFKAVIVTILPRMSGKFDGKSEPTNNAAIEKKVSGRIKRVAHLLSVLDTQLEKQRTRTDRHATDVCLLGGHTNPTWADFYMYPIMASIFQSSTITPEFSLYRTHAPLLYAWYQRFGTTDWARQTYPASSSL